MTSESSVLWAIGALSGNYLEETNEQTKRYQTGCEIGVCIFADAIRQTFAVT